MNCTNHPLYYSSNCTCTSDIVWFKIKDDTLLKFCYYGHEIEISIKKENEKIKVRTTFDLIFKGYVPKCYTSLWVYNKKEFDKKEMPSYVHYFTEEELTQKKIYYKWEKENEVTENKEEDLYIGFYIYL